MKGCLRFEKDSWFMTILGYIGVVGWFVVVVLYVMFAQGCSAPAKKQIREKICPPAKVCPSQPKCPPSFSGMYQESERAADRLEDKLTIAEAQAEACEKAFNRYQRKSTR
jgi:hypothetical protein